MRISVNIKVSEWLRSQPWIGKFLNNLIRECKEPDDVLMTLLGTDGTATISCAFSWEDTPEGRAFWEKIDRQFCNMFFDKGWKKYNLSIDI